MIRASSLVTLLATGGYLMDLGFILQLLPSCSCVMAEAAIALVLIYLKRLYKRATNELGIEIRIAHYPPYTSKYNPIEHRLFPHLTRACSGVIFDSWKTVKSLMAKAKTRTGLRVFATIIEGIYATGKKVALEFKQNLPIIFDEYLPQWNYIVQPQST